VLTTTNGTHALHLSRSAKAGFDRIFPEYYLVMQLFKKVLEGNILLVCAGWQNNFNLEDTLFAGAVIEQLKGSGYTLR
jgi:2-phosphosulfolactate phosphatase